MIGLTWFLEAERLDIITVQAETGSLGKVEVERFQL